MKFLLSSKIHKATVTDADLNYVGSIGIDKALMEQAGLWPGEKVLVVDNTNGARLETYTIEEENCSGRVVMYGAASRLIKKGDEIIIMAFEMTDTAIKAKVVLVDKNNRFVKFL